MYGELVGYLVGALDQDEATNVERLLASNDEARRMLEVLRSGLLPLAVDQALHTPPSGLASRTCERLQGMWRGVDR
jgi:anti-sigma-K factor RskA